MAQTKIAWTWRTHPETGIMFPGFTQNFWIGCTEKGPECVGCYAKLQDYVRFSRNLGGGTPEAPIFHWGKGAPRYRTEPANWRKPYGYNRQAKAAGIALAVFTNSLSDFFDQEVSDDIRREALEVIDECNALDWMILTKRSGEACDYFSKEGKSRPHAWIGATMGCKRSIKERAEHLLATPNCARRFISAEPLLEDITDELKPYLEQGGIDLVIVGGESQSDALGHKARPMHPDWVDRLHGLCWANNVSFFFKQWGHWAPAYELTQDPQLQAMCALDSVRKHVFDTGEGGRRVVFAGGRNTGHLLNGKIVQEMPKVRRV